MKAKNLYLNHLNGKIFKIKILVLLLPVFLISIYSCSDSSVQTPEVNYNIVTSVSGEILNLPSNARLIKGFVKYSSDSLFIDSRIIDSTNYLNLNLNSVPDKYLLGMDYFFRSDSNIIISDTNAKVNKLDINGYDLNFDSYVCHIYRVSELTNPSGNILIKYYYCNKNVSIKGRKKFVFAENDSAVIYYNVNFGIGWNILVERENIVNENYTEIKIKNDTDEGSIWYAVQFPTDNKNKLLFSEIWNLQENEYIFLGEE
ncbi:MAG: hypothetical protein WAT71_01210 [Ignavibacteria bacterium]